MCGVYTSKARRQLPRPWVVPAFYDTESMTMHRITVSFGPFLVADPRA